MNSRVLSGVKIVVIAYQEILRTEVYGVLGAEGLVMGAVFPENDGEIVDSLKSDRESIIAVVLEQSAATLDKIMRILRDSNIEDSQIAVGCPSGSLVHRAYVRSGMEGFEFNSKATPTGMNVDLSTLPATLQSIWHKRCDLQLNAELKDAMESSALALVRACTGRHTTAEFKERAHLAFSLSNHINYDLSFRLRVIRLSLFGDLVYHPEWRGVVEESRNLWVIKDLLELRADNLEPGKLSELSWRADLPMELAIVECVSLLQMKGTSSEEEFKRTLKARAKSLPLETRVSLNQAIEACFNRVWRRKDELKASNQS